MAIVKMNKLSVIGMNQEKKSLLKDLMDLGVVEISGSADKLQDENWQKLVVKTVMRPRRQNMTNW